MSTRNSTSSTSPNSGANRPTSPTSLLAVATHFLDYAFPPTPSPLTEISMSDLSPIMGTESLPHTPSSTSTSEDSDVYPYRHAPPIQFDENGDQYIDLGNARFTWSPQEAAKVYNLKSLSKGTLPPQLNPHHLDIIEICHGHQPFQFHPYTLFIDPMHNWTPHSNTPFTERVPYCAYRYLVTQSGYQYWIARAYFHVECPPLGSALFSQIPEEHPDWKEEEEDGQVIAYIATEDS
ncbi:hypothetical protein BDQ17DRAFT_1334137 [Cyathus striatus]|nr:hypothetical protein BDQ17DRAFT_1334137 [Cyathus striatus]